MIVVVEVTTALTIGPLLPRIGHVYHGRQKPESRSSIHRAAIIR